MFVIDDILLSPVRGFMWIMRELHNAAHQELEGEADRLTHRLSTLYMLLETGQVTNEEFDAQERDILARLEALQHGEDEDVPEIEEDDVEETTAQEPLSDTQRSPGTEA
ncbi:MAG: gas vesicle protein GvpG [Planctomycetota bacterium]|nr:gas vesicle protein GvpG [Planctomycetota bacterium]